jgi:hypothetical protein
MKNMCLGTRGKTRGHLQNEEMKAAKETKLYNLFVYPLIETSGCWFNGTRVLILG